MKQLEEANEELENDALHGTSGGQGSARGAGAGAGAGADSAGEVSQLRREL